MGQESLQESEETVSLHTQKEGRLSRNTGTLFKQGRKMSLDQPSSHLNLSLLMFRTMRKLNSHLVSITFFGLSCQTSIRPYSINVNTQPMASSPLFPDW